MLAFFLLAFSNAIDPEQGTLNASQGAFQRALDPSLYDAFFPCFAFLMVIILPTIIALWVIYRTWSK